MGGAVCVGGWGGWGAAVGRSWGGMAAAKRAVGGSEGVEEGVEKGVEEEGIPWGGFVETEGGEEEEEFSAGADTRPLTFCKKKRNYNKTPIQSKKNKNYYCAS